MILCNVFLLCLSLALGGWGLLGSSRRKARRVFTLIFASGLFFTSFFLLVQQLHVHRHISVVQESWLGALTTPQEKAELFPGKRCALPVRVENQGSEAFDSTLREYPVFLSYHLLASDGKVLRFDNPRIAFGEPLRPRQEQTLVVLLESSGLGLAPGAYFLEFDLVREGAFWFAANSRAARTLKVPLQVHGEQP